MLGSLLSVFSSFFDSSFFVNYLLLLCVFGFVPALINFIRFIIRGN